MKRTPIALFCYNRPEHLAATIHALIEADGIGESVVHAFSDGPKDEEDLRKVRRVRDVLRGLGKRLRVVLHEREGNLGLRQSIVQGVTELCETYGRAIVLEDDIQVSRHFLTYMNQALERYADEERVMHVAAYFPPVSTDGLPESFFFRPTSCWGWGTWADRWRHLDLDAESLCERLAGERGHAFNLNGAYDFLEHLKLNLEGRINTWAVFWYATVFLRGGLCLHPARSMARNMGHDGSGANCKSTSVFDVDLASESVHTFPHELRETPLALARVRTFYLSQKGL